MLNKHLTPHIPPRTLLKAVCMLTFIPHGTQSCCPCRYLQFVKDLQEASRDNLAFIKEKAVKAIYDLLRSNPEQEALLLTALVDKLGDPSRKLASNVWPSSSSFLDGLYCCIISTVWRCALNLHSLKQFKGCCQRGFAILNLHLTLTLSLAQGGGSRLHTDTRRLLSQLAAALTSANTTYKVTIENAR